MTDTDPPPPGLSNTALNGMLIEMLTELDALRARALNLNRQMTIAVILNAISIAAMLGATLWRNLFE